MVRTVLVTGGTRGIGASIAIAFKDAGYSVAANYARNDEEARKFEEENGIPVFKFDAGNYQGSCDAVEEVKRVSQYICKNKGGDGAVREFVDLIIKKTLTCRAIHFFFEIMVFGTNC